MKTKFPGTGVSRRVMLRQLAAAGAVAAWPFESFPQARAGLVSGRTVVASYLAGLARADGGYAWPDQERSHLTPTFAAVGAHRLLGQVVPNAAAVAEFIREHHPARLKKLEQEHHEFEWQQIQSLRWLGADAASFRQLVRSWKSPTAYLKQYEQHGWPILRHEVAAFVGRELLGLPVDDLSPAYVAYLDSRRRANGSFNNSPASDGGDGHALNTWWGLQALRALGRHTEQSQTTAEWLRACQLPAGGFTWQPKPEFAGVDDVAYTWAALRSLQLVGAAPANRDGCVAYLLSLWNGDGGFGDCPGWASNPLATYYALDALAALGALDQLVVPRRQPPRPLRPPAPWPADFRVYSIQIEAHGTGSPAEAVDLARALRIHLWGAKNAKPAWLARAQALADQQQAPVKFFVANEEYGTWVRVPGLGVYSHTSDIIAPAGADCGALLAKQGVVSWPEFRERRLGPLTRGGGRLIWQFGENEELVRLYLDDSIERGGYAAISTFHFGNPDFTITEPFLHRWRGRIPFVALQDAHGSEPWWFADMTAGFRTLFLAAAPTWAGWIEALRNNWVAAVRRDAVSNGQLWLHAGSREVAEFVRQREADWRWWDNPAIERPVVSIVAVRPADEFEAGRPDQGVVIRVRCAWENTAQGLPKKPLAELVRLSVDGAEVSPRLVPTKAARGSAYADHYHAFALPTPASGRHTATAVVRVLATGAEARRTIEFEA